MNRIKRVQNQRVDRITERCSIVRLADAADAWQKDIHKQVCNIIPVGLFQKRFRRPLSGFADEILGIAYSLSTGTVTEKCAVEVGWHLSFYFGYLVIVFFIQIFQSTMTSWNLI